MLFILFLPGTVVLSQVSKDSVILNEILNENFTVAKSYKTLPGSIRQYLNNLYGKDFKISNKKFNSSDVNKKESTSRSMSYVATSYSKNSYILSYDHGGKAHHHHTLIFNLRGDKVTNVYNLITPIHTSVVELRAFIESKTYSIQTIDEI